MAKEPHSHGKRVCIFCEGESETKISAEHIWAEWMAGLLPPSEMHGVFEAKVDKADRTIETHKDWKRQGAVNTYRVRSVCRRCNSGWMGDYEEAVRPFLAEMMLGKPTHLSEREHRLLVEYLVLKILVMDAGLADPFIPPAVARSFYFERAIPDALTIHVLTCVEGEWQVRMCCLGGAFGEISDPKMPPNVKSFALGIGFLFVFAVLRKEGEFDFHFEPGAAIQLWPFLTNEVRWPTLRPVNSAQADFVAQSVWRVGTANVPPVFGH